MFITNRIDPSTTTSARDAGLSTTTTLLRAPGAAREQCERELNEAGIPMPMTSRSAWAAHSTDFTSWFLAARDGGGRCRGGLALEVRPSRVLPGHLLLRAERVGATLPGPVMAAVIAGLVGLARGTRRVLRVNVETFARDDAARAALERELAAGGFVRVAENRRYARTIAVDLTKDESALFAGLHKTARQNIRSTAKHPVAVRPIVEDAVIPRMESLLAESLARTGGTYRRQDWAARIEFSKAFPSLSRIVGLFRTDLAGPDGLLAWSWGCNDGDYAHYDASASTRNTDLKLSLAYPLLWDLICWGKREGATWFDLGGITVGSQADADPLGGISDFKRYFSKDVVQVGGEWQLEPHWVQAKLARAVSAGVRWLGRPRAGRPRAATAQSIAAPAATTAFPASDPGPGALPAPLPAPPEQV